MRDADRISNVTKKKRVGFNLPELKRKEALYDGNKMTRQKGKKKRTKIKHSTGEKGK